MISVITRGRPFFCVIPFPFLIYQIFIAYRYRREVLRFGGAREPEKIIRNLIGRAPTVDDFVKHLVI